MARWGNRTGLTGRSNVVHRMFSEQVKMFTERSLNKLKAMNEINKFPVKDLPSRYSVGRTALYARFTAANITPEKDGTRSYISGEELEELDRLDSHIKTGGKLEDFKPTLQQSNEMILAPALDKADNFTEALQLVEAIARHFATPHDPLQHYAALSGRSRPVGYFLQQKFDRSLGLSHTASDLCGAASSLSELGRLALRQRGKF